MRPVVRSVAAWLFLAGLVPGTGVALGQRSGGNAVPEASESQITVSGAGIPGTTYNLAQAYGDWFMTARDGHASLTLRTVGGLGRPGAAQLAIEWDGRALAQTITSSNSSGVGGDNRFSFDLILPAAGGTTRHARLSGGDAIAVTITRMDEQALEATIAGTATAGGPLNISGTIKLHRMPAYKGMVSGAFADCDPHIYDKLAGAEWRSPSECEVKFDLYVRQALVKTMQPAVDALAGQGWVVGKTPELGPIDSKPRHSEGAPYQIGPPHAVAWSMSLPQDSEGYKRYNDATMSIMQKAMEQLKNGGTPAVSQDAMLESSRALAGHTSIQIGVGINDASVGMTLFKGGYTVAPLAGGGFTVTAPYVQAPTGGDIGGSQQVTYVFLGAFTPPPGSAPGAAGNVSVKGSLRAARLMAVQNLAVRIQAAPELAAQVMGSMDWNGLRGLVGR